ncbi:hypothetical protein PYW07_011663 [Mythimna separata]|uniref:Uncharacterized protein n=1 Tax=Mythimna separata TaxID=271217 RepID=A0AAD7Y6M9_MYTSE|nr:hypothetical protein PYW07_011663 [Mythimna separata]
MAAKSILVLCASACFVKIISAQCLGTVNNAAASALAAEELLANAHTCGAPYPGQGHGYSYVANAIAPSSGGGFVVQSISPIAPTGITVMSENAFEGNVAVNGNLPFLAAIALDGALPTSGAGGINYGCGNGAVGIVSEGVTPGAAPTAYPAGMGYATGLAGGMGYGAGLANGMGYNGRPGLGLGCGAAY